MIGREENEQHGGGNILYFGVSVDPDIGSSASLCIKNEPGSIVSSDKISKHRGPLFRIMHLQIILYKIQSLIHHNSFQGYILITSHLCWAFNNNTMRNSL